LLARNDVRRELHGVIPVLPIVLEEPGEPDLFSQLKKHQLRQKDRGDLCRALAASHPEVMSALVGHR
jgi:hypothetical protein